MKLISWNVNGLRAVIKKDFLAKVEAMGADAVCIQETKAQDDQVREALAEAASYHIYCSSALRKGYSGTAMLCRREPLSVTMGIGIEEHDQEGRTITAEFDDYYLVDVYVPNSGAELARLGYREQWDKDLFAYLKKLEQTKPVVICGDFNVAHEPIDIARPKENYNKAAGYTQKEIDGMDRFVGGGFIDTYRHFFPDKKEAYSWWSYRFGAREKNIGWRIDYFLISSPLLPRLKEAFILPTVDGSDHCPVGIILD
jgi:exodeoxyribonuclease-3